MARPKISKDDIEEGENGILGIKEKMILAVCVCVSVREREKKKCKREKKKKIYRLRKD